MSLNNSFIHKAYFITASYLTSNKCYLMYLVLFSSILGLSGCSKSSPPIDKTRATLSQAYGIWYALHAYKAKHGQLPEELELLVPKFLPTLDPPYSHPKRGWIYIPNCNGFSYLEKKEGSFFLGFYVADPAGMHNYGFSSERIESMKGAMIAPSVYEDE